MIVGRMNQRGSCGITVNGMQLQVSEGSSVAAALLNSAQCLRSEPSTWTPVCGMGTCWGCRATIDGVVDRRSCLVPVRGGMVVETESVDTQVDERSNVNEFREPPPDDRAPRAES
jgi:sarcosine oxidase subunit alpha